MHNATSAASTIEKALLFVISAEMSSFVDNDEATQRSIFLMIDCMATSLGRTETGPSMAGSLFLINTIWHKKQEAEPASFDLLHLQLAHRRNICLLHGAGIYSRIEG